MPILRMTMVWQGFAGAPGYTNLHFLNPDTPTQVALDETAVKVKTWLQTIAPYLPSTAAIGYPGTMDMLDTATGDLLDVFNIPVQAATQGASGSAYSAAVGACVNWQAVGIVNGRRLRGRTFLVPLAGAFAPDGTLDNSFRTTLLTASNTFANSTSGLDISVWHRPSPGGSDGAAGQVTAATITDKTAVLRSRRD